MNINELDELLRKNTEREQFYLDNQGSISPSYSSMDKKIINGKRSILL